MESECLPFSSIPRTSRLFQAYLAQDPAVRTYFPSYPRFTDKQWLAEQARGIRYDPERRARVAAILERQNQAWGASRETLDNIARFRSGAAVAVTGQQVGLFGGPLFSLYKALTAIRIADEVSRAGFDCVPVFWLATEDHDLAEINHATLLAPDGTLLAVSTSSAGAPNAPVSDIRLGQEIVPVVDQAVGALDGSELSELLRRSYRPGETLGSAFAKLFSALFRHSGVILIDASDPELHHIASPVYRAAILGAEELDAALLERSTRLEAEGFHAQVKVTPSSTLLFGRKDGARAPVHRANGGFELGEEKFARDQLLSRIQAEPHQFSANVLLRPVVEDYLLPTLAYVGGPAEVAYFAQAAVVYEQLVGRVTPIVPRFSATLVEPKIKRLMDRYRISLPELFRAPDEFREKLAGEALPADVNAAFDQAFTELESSLAAIRGSLAGVDPTLVEAAKRAGSKMQYQLNRLRARAARAELRRREELTRHANELLNALHPDKQLQEREIAGISFLARYGTQLLLRLYDATPLGCHQHQVIYL